jgi:2-C-methyl-D-erythritol 2,4-cyclodiphosphate synthase
MDALLGATAQGDLGTHFPSDDPAHAGADSIRLLERVVALVRTAGYRIGSVDTSVIAQAPRLAPHIAGMRDRLAAALQIGRDAVSVKATTNDGLGIVGAGEAIAALATVIVEKFEP